ncbi:hypothetical protein RRG08_008845 [Elysia crispata]|uniref:Uncharacterized protein n=1 Tax=Elysia crispata TaxID=231223 RepID=A0AAE1DVX7_9GAST|nr:hypothetical protein RRG08_008845 [Elysia crispata]
MSKRLQSTVAWLSAVHMVTLRDTLIPVIVNGHCGHAGLAGEAVNAMDCRLEDSVDDAILHLDNTGLI